MNSVDRHILDLSRRGLLTGAVAMAALRAVTPARAQGGGAAPRFAADPFPLGVASGDPAPDGFVIWTRPGPDPLGGGDLPPHDVEVAWEVAEDDAFAHVAARGTATARAALNHAVHVEVTGLRPGRFYHYRFVAGGVASPVGRSCTAPAPDARPGRLRLGIGGCQHYEQGWFTAWRHVAEEDLDLVFHYGDYIYEYEVSPARAVRRHGVDPDVRTLDAYRRRHALYRLDPDLRAAHAAHPFAVSFDDHELENNWSESSGPRTPDPVAFALRRAAALRAWYEAMPVRRAAMPQGPGITAWRALGWGRLADLAVLDTRSARTVQPCGDGVRAVCDAVADPAAGLLGAAQEAWLLRRLTAPGPTWRLLGQQVMMMGRDFGNSPTVPGPRFNMDYWDGYPAARARLLGAVREAGTRNLVVLTGDVHAAWAGTLRDGGRDVGVEIVSTSATSGYDGAEITPAGTRALALNPHIAFHNNRRGYTVLEATEARLAATFRAVPAVTRQGVGVEDRATFVVEEGQAALHRA